MAPKDKNNPEKIRPGASGEQSSEHALPTAMPGSAADAEVPDIPRAVRTTKWLNTDLSLVTPVQANILNNMQYMMEEITDLKGMVAEVRVMALPALIGDRHARSARSTTMGSDENAPSSRRTSGQRSQRTRQTQQVQLGPVNDLINRHEEILLSALSEHKAAGGKILITKSKYVSVETEKYFAKLTEKLSVDQRDIEEGLTENPVLTEFNGLNEGQRTSLFTMVCNRASKTKVTTTEGTGTTSDPAQPVLGKTRSAMKAAQEQSPSKKATIPATDYDNNGKAGEPRSSQQM